MYLCIVMANKYVKYRRVSTQKQGDSGLGLDAQDYTINYFIGADKDAVVVGEYVEVYTGTDLKGCVELRKAIDHAKAEGAKLIMAKSDRFRNVAEALGVLDELGEGNLVCCDVPGASRFEFTIFWAIAEREALLISLRTKAALDSARREIADKGYHRSKRGNICTGFGNPKWKESIVELQEAGVEARRKLYMADPKRQRAFKMAADLRKRGVKKYEIIDSLNAMGDDFLPDGQKAWNYRNYDNMTKVYELYTI